MLHTTPQMMVEADTVFARSLVAAWQPHQKQTPFMTSQTIVLRRCTSTKPMSLHLNQIVAIVSAKNWGFNVNGGTQKWNQRRNKPLNNQSHDCRLVQLRKPENRFLAQSRRYGKG